MEKARPHTSAPLNKDSDRDPEYEFYYFADLVAKGIVRNRTDLHRKIRNEGFPRPEKSSNSMQSAAPYRKARVHAWLDRRAGAPPCEPIKRPVSQEVVATD
ncbi:hypothetical protein U8C41_23530 [Sinorhizobium meliloti]|uniref:hypothetical protein n=1 Tax=Rhizobium meliloti TaxID=382 RepID=UPI000D1DB679|nr:hypothetical protein [Sinorhizobium meliloti]RMI10068.1 hypothetical protein DA101_001350 [Sinorhizobium meliloti]WQP02502.1 hypothetical protein U8C41_23530 [Sinorhizobium meliloti]